MILLISIIFIAGYAAIALEHPLKINKAATALLTGVLCWSVFALFSEDKQHVAEMVTEHLGELAGILFFLLGAMTIVELIDAHDGFEIITSRIRTTNKRKLIWIEKQVIPTIRKLASMGYAEELMTLIAEAIAAARNEQL